MTKIAASARRLSRLSALAYKDNLDAQQMGADHVIDLAYESHRCYVLVHDETIDIIFRGTDDIVDWLTNGRLWFNTEDSNCAMKESREATRIHEGFDAACDGLMPLLISTLRTYRTRFQKLVLSGHSLGGALAVETAMRFLAYGLPVFQVMTFGAPRVGDKAYAARYNEKLGRATWHFVNKADPVPWLPSKWFGYDRQPSAWWHDGHKWHRKMPCYKWAKVAITARRKWLFLPHVIGDHDKEKYASLLDRSCPVSE